MIYKINKIFKESGFNTEIVDDGVHISLNRSVKSDEILTVLENNSLEKQVRIAHVYHIKDYWKLTALKKETKDD